MAFEEIPPGALGSAVTVAGVSAVLTVALTFAAPVIEPRGPDMAALVLAVPLFAATLVGHSMERVQRSDVVTYWGLGAAGVIAFAGAIIFGLVPASDLTWEASGKLHFPGLPKLHVAGLVLSLLALGNLAYLWRKLRYRLRAYAARRERWHDLDRATRHW